MEINPITTKERIQVNNFITQHWFSIFLAIRGELVDSSHLDGFIALEEETIVGLVTYRFLKEECEITSLDSLHENKGIGTALINKVKEAALERNCLKIKLITTNDNINALRFYQKRGFDMTKLYYNSIETSRELKPSIPLTGDFGIPIRHEIEFEFLLQNSFSEPDMKQDIKPDTKPERKSDQKPERKPDKVYIYTDGSARGNPDGPGGYGTILVYVDAKGVEHEREFSAGFKKTTNNRMELMAAIIGLEALTKPCSVIIYSDSQYLVKAFNDNWIEGWIKKGWKKSQNDPVKNVDLWKRLLKAMEIHKVTFEWVRGHNGHPMNERCDVLATTAADGDNLAEDVIM